MYFLTDFVGGIQLSMALSLFGSLSYFVLFVKFGTIPQPFYSSRLFPLQTRFFDWLTSKLLNTHLYVVLAKNKTRIMVAYFLTRIFLIDFVSGIQLSFTFWLTFLFCFLLIFVVIFTVWNGVGVNSYSYVLYRGGIFYRTKWLKI